MLTLSNARQLLIIPIMTGTIISCTPKATTIEEPQRNGNEVTYNGNVIAFSDKRPDDTTEVYNSETGEPAIVITTYEPVPATLNGEMIYRQPEPGDNPDYINVATKAAGITDKALKKDLLDRLGHELAKLEDGEYVISLQYIILDKSGKVAYFEISEMAQVVLQDGRQERIPLKQDLQNELTKKIRVIMNELPAYEPAGKDGKNVSVMIDSGVFYKSFTLKGGKVVS